MAQPNFPSDRECLPLGLPASIDTDFLGGQPINLEGLGDPVPLPEMPQIEDYINWSATAIPQLSSSVTDLGRDMYNWTIDAMDSLPGLQPPIDISIENIDPSNYQDLSTGVSANAGNTNINIGGDNNQQSNNNQGNNFFNSMFGFGVGIVVTGFRRAPVVPAVAKTDISAYDCDTGKPGSGAVNLQYHVSDNEITPEIIKAFQNMQLAISNAQNTGDWSNVQAAIDAWIQAIGSLLHGDDGGGGEITWVALNISTEEIPAGSPLLVSPDQFGNFWVTVASCGEC